MSKMTHSYKMIHLCRMLLFFSFFSFSVLAQTTWPAASKIPQKQSKAALSYSSAVTQKLEAIRERTASGYYARIFKAQEGPDQVKGFALRTALACDVSCASAPLPVTLLSFRAERVDASQVLLKWETSSETNNMGFGIERAQNTAVGFEQIGFVDGNGNTTASKKYVLTDRNAYEDISYYRLKQLDYDGTYMYSRIVAVAGTREALAVVSVPNPGPQRSSFLQVKGNDHSGQVQLSIVDLKGRLLYQNTEYVLGNTKRIALSDLPALRPGVFIAKIVSGNQHSAVTFVISDP